MEVNKWNNLSLFDLLKEATKLSYENLIPTLEALVKKYKEITSDLNLSKKAVDKATEALEDQALSLLESLTLISVDEEQEKHINKLLMIFNYRLRPDLVVNRNLPAGANRKIKASWSGPFSRNSRAFGRT